MNKTPYLVAAIVALMATAPTAYAEGHMYGKVGANINFGTSITTDDESLVDSSFVAKPGVMSELALGYNLGNSFAVELSYQKSGGSVKHLAFEGVSTTTPINFGDLIFTSTILRGIYNLPIENTAMYNPYIGLGIGITNIKLDSLLFPSGSFSTADGSATSTQLTLGNRFESDKRWFADVAVNYTSIASTALEDTTSLKISSSSVISVSFAVGQPF